jgi:RNA polymerase sigma-70 factor (ECF subfamily)
MPTIFEMELLECIPELQRYAHKLTGERASAEDLVQDCLERALRNIDKFQPGTNLDAWLATILKNIFLSERRRSQRCPHAELADHDCAVPPPQMWRIALHEVEEAIEELSSEHRKVIELVAIDGEAYQDAAVRLDVPVGTIRSRLSRAREQIRVNLDRRRSASRRSPPPAMSPVAVRPAPSKPAASLVPRASGCRTPMRWPRPSRLPASVARLPIRHRRCRPLPVPQTAPLRAFARSRGPPGALPGGNALLPSSSSERRLSMKPIIACLAPQ